MNNLGIACPIRTDYFYYLDCDGDPRQMRVYATRLFCAVVKRNLWNSELKKLGLNILGSLYV